ncbi:hypothetical protein GRI69_11730 [Erythrobacter vulgaris]|uniref:Uncharacterized protein n=1 Tax=Qipengyuania vulgaris TaxID=291985 RepID=A0A844XUN1_9SPHN|nr:hypothetical protein [Qipengyuania vulgaris]
MSCYRWSIITFLVTLSGGYGSRQAIGSIYGAAEAVDLLEALSRAGLYLGSAIATASATTIALMLTLIGLIKRMDEDFDEQAYRNVELVARLSTVTLLIALLLLMAFALPVGEFKEMPQSWFENLYNALYYSTVVMVGTAAATVVLIYTTLLQVMAKITPGDSI